MWIYVYICKSMGVVGGTQDRQRKGTPSNFVDRNQQIMDLKQLKHENPLIFFKGGFFELTEY